MIVNNRAIGDYGKAAVGFSHKEDVPYRRLFAMNRGIHGYRFSQGRRSKVASFQATGRINLLCNPTATWRVLDTNCKLSI